MDFLETITLEIPDIQNQLSSLEESKNDSSHGLVIEIAALHSGTTANFNHYSAEALEGALESWVTPYPKPVLLHHDQMTDPIGRVMASKMDKEEDDTPYTRLQVAITDPEAVKKVSDGRYLTCSVGGKALEANCSVCNANWSNASMFDLPCKHRRGNVYKGEVAKINFKKVAFKEISFVNSPADSKSGIRPSKADITDSDDEESDGWVHARVFDINMDKEEIVEFTESETRNVLSGMRKKDSSPLYLQLKGAFLSALAVAESDEENSMSDEEILEETSSEEDDVLLVSEELSSDLAQPDEEESTENEDEDVEPSEEEESDEDSADDDAEEKIAPKPEGQEKPTGDVDPERGTNVPLSRQSDDEEDLETEEEESEESSETELNDETESLQETVNTLESHVEELETKNQTLSEENARLRNALKRGLAERVVDTKVALGLAEQAEREELLEEHLERSSRSLADSLRDLASMKPRVVDYADFPTIESQGVAVLDNKSEEPVITIDVPEENHIQSPEDIFVDALMGRRKL